MKTAGLVRTYLKQGPERHYRLSRRLQIFARFLSPKTMHPRLLLICAACVFSAVLSSMTREISWFRSTSEAAAVADSQRSSQQGTEPGTARVLSLEVQARGHDRGLEPPRVLDTPLAKCIRLERVCGLTDDGPLRWPMA